MMSQPATNLAAPLSTPLTPSQLAVYNGIPEGQKIYVAIKGTVFDVTAKSDMYGPGKSYHVFAGKDASKGLGMSSVKIEVSRVAIDRCRSVGYWKRSSKPLKSRRASEMSSPSP